MRKLNKRVRVPKSNASQLCVESLEDKLLLAADLVSLSPADGAASVNSDANLVLTFSEAVQKGPGTGNISIFNADTNALIEVVNVNSDQVTFDGASVTVDPSADLASNANFYVQVDPSAIRDMSADVASATLMAEDFEGLDLQDSSMATDAILLDVNDYVLVMTGVLDVKVAGEYTFGVNSDDGQQLAIDVAQDGLDLIDDEVIFDNTTHGNQDRLSVCGIDFAGQNCVGAAENDAIQLDVGEYEFEYWYFERGGGSSGEFYYAPGLHETFSAADFAVVGDDSKGIGVTADGITATTYKSASDQIASLDASIDLIEGFSDLAPGFPVEAKIPTADVWNTGGTGRFPGNHPLPGFPDPTPDQGTDWTDEGPIGWGRETRDLPEGIPPEFSGWTFLDKYFWINQQGNQNRLDWVDGEGVVAVADNDAFGDFTDDPMNASLSSPKIFLTGAAANSATISFDSSWSWEDETPQIATFSVEFFDDADASLGSSDLFRWTTDSTDGDFKDIARNESIEDLALSNPEGAASMVVTWDLSEAGDNRWWAIDNVVVEANVAGAAFAGITDSDGWDFNTFGAPSISFTGPASVSEDGGSATLTVSRQGVTDAAVSVSWATSPGTASAADFVAANGVVEFAAGETEKMITVDIVEDETAEINESFTVSLSNPTGGAELGEASSTTITILDNDRPEIIFQEGVEIVDAGEATGVTYEGTTDADPAGQSPDGFRDLLTLNPDGSDGGEPVHGLTAFKNLFGDGPGLIPEDAVITQATLTLNITNEGTPLTVHRMLADWNEEEITWNELIFNGNDEPGIQGDGVEATEVLREFDTAPAMVTDVDVTEDLQAWHSGEAENFGWAFLPTGNNGVDWDSSEAEDTSVRPKLTVEYVIPPDEPVGIAGDVDGDLDVDFDDFVALSNTFGQSVDPPGSGADFSGNGVVDFDDFVALSNNFGQTAQAAAVDAALSELADE